MWLLEQGPALRRFEVQPKRVRPQIIRQLVGQGGFSHLPRAENGHCRAFPEAFLGQCEELPLDHPVFQCPQI
jgi:hypothetical protein